MLQRTLQLFAAIAVTSAALGACTTKGTDTDIDPQTGGNGSGNSGNTGGDVTTGGAGGAGADGGGGSGNIGNAPACVGAEDGSGLTAEACDGMNITPSCAGGVAAVCTDGAETFYSPGWRTCDRAFDVFHGGAIDVLVGCLDDIGVNPEACEEQPVADCIGAMYDASCDDNTYANDNCLSVNQGCVDAGEDTFDLNGCYSGLKPFSQAGVDLYIACQNDHLADPCADIHDICMGEVITVNPLPASCTEATD